MKGKIITKDPILDGFRIQIQYESQDPDGPNIKVLYVGPDFANDVGDEVETEDLYEPSWS